MREPSRSFARSQIIGSRCRCGSGCGWAPSLGVLRKRFARRYPRRTSDAAARDGGAPSLDGMTAMDTGASADTSIVGQADAESTDATSADARSSDGSDAARWSIL